MLAKFQTRLSIIYMSGFCFVVAMYYVENKLLEMPPVHAYNLNEC